MLKLDNISISQDQQVIFSGLNVEINKGEFWGVIGQNGVGKSTLLQTIVGMNPIAAGCIQVNQEDITSLSHITRAQTFSYLLQDQEPCLAFSVREAVGMGRFPWQSKKSDDMKITDAALQICRISHLADKSILKLSGGERRKVEIATCIAQQSEFLLLDEPLNHLDLVYQQHILSTFKNISNSNAVVMVCHDLESVKKHCTHVLMLLANNCYLTGTSATILTNENIKRLFNDYRQYD